MNGEGNGTPLQDSCLENPMDGGAWWAAFYGVAQSWTGLKRLSSSLAAYVMKGFPGDAVAKIPLDDVGDTGDTGSIPGSGIYPGGGNARESPICRVWRDAAAAAAKMLQSCPTLCDPIDSSPPGSAVPGILQARTLEWLPFPSPMHESEM